MELAVVDTFVRSDASRGGSRASDMPAVSFSDILDASTREPEPAPRVAEPAARTNEPRSPEHAEAPAAPTRDATEPRREQAANAKADEPRAETADRHETKAKPETAKADSRPESGDKPAETAPAQTATQTAPDTAAAPDPGLVAEAQGQGAAALDLLASLLETGNATVDPSTPKGQLVAALIVPQNVPEHAAAAGHHVIPGLTAPVAPGTAAELQQPTPAGTTAAPPPVAPTGANPTANQVEKPAAPPSGLLSTPSQANAAAPASDTPVAAAAAPAATPPPAPTPVPAAPASAAPQAAVPTTTSAAVQPAEALVAELAEIPDVSALDIAADDDVAAPLASATQGTSTTTARPAATQTSTTGYMAQVVSQQASPGEGAAPQAAPADDPAAPVPVGPRTADSTLLSDATTSGDDALAPAKPAEGMPLTATDTNSTREAHSVETAAAARAARPAVVPMPEQIVVRIAKAIADGVDRINVKLSPAELGQIDVRMEIGPDGRFHAVFAADRPQTVELLQRDARELARALQDAGLRADTGSLSFNLRGQGQQDQAGNGNGPAQGGSLPGLAQGADLPADVAPQAIYRASGVGTGRVDIRV